MTVSRMEKILDSPSWGGWGHVDAFHLFTPFPSAHELDMAPSLRNLRSLGDTVPNSEDWSLVLSQGISQGLWEPRGGDNIRAGL